MVNEAPQPPLDIDLADGRPGYEPYEGFGFPPIPIPEPFGRIKTAAETVFGLGHIIAIVHGDQLDVPEKIRNADHIHEIADLLARRFDPLYNLVKIQIHRNLRGNNIGWGVVEGMLAGFDGVVGVFASLTAHPLWWGSEAFLGERTFVHTVRATEENDRVHDEKQRIGRHWREHFVSQVMEAATQAGFADDEFMTQALGTEAGLLINQRYAAYQQFIHGKGGKERLKQAIRNGVDLYDARNALRKHGRGLTGLRPRIVRALEEEVVSFYPKVGRYVSRKQLDAEAKAAQRAADKAAKSPRRHRLFH